MKIGDIVEVPCKRCSANAGECPCNTPSSATIVAVGKLFVTVRLHEPPPRWRERGLSEHAKYRPARLRVIAILAENRSTKLAQAAVVEFDQRRR
jgi:hypothetical protein